MSNPVSNRSSISAKYRPMQSWTSRCDGSAGAISTSAAVSSRSTSAIAPTSRARRASLSGSSSDLASPSAASSSSSRSLTPSGVSRATRTRRSAGVRPDDDEPVGLERPQQPAEIAGIEPEQRPQAHDIAALRPDLPEHARLAERPVSREEVVVERADTLGHEPVEAADLGHLRWGNRAHRSLILVRDRGLRLTGRASVGNDVSVLRLASLVLLVSAVFATAAGSATSSAGSGRPGRRTARTPCPPCSAARSTP